MGGGPCWAIIVYDYSASGVSSDPSSGARHDQLTLRECTTYKGIVQME